MTLEQYKKQNHEKTALSCYKETLKNITRKCNSKYMYS